MKRSDTPISRSRTRRRRVLRAAAAVLVVAGAAVIAGFAIQAEGRRHCAGLEVEVAPGGDVQLVEGEDVRAAVEVDGPLAGRSAEAIDLAEVLRRAESLPAVKEAEVYTSLNGTVHVRVTQREPVARLHLSAQTEDVYLDAAGETFPIVVGRNVRVPIVHAPSVVLARPALAVVARIQEDPVWSEFVDQIALTPRGLELVPRIGDVRIVLGDTTNLDDKFRRLSTFYREVASRGDLETYSRIVLAYDDQVVGVRRSPLASSHGTTVPATP
jgi:cell division protein FtsQ